ncbi:hypothetical protein MMC25_001263 [Agyrium rufum]|nr:hypothetical protein [Agyrium rufum]
MFYSKASVALLSLLSGTSAFSLPYLNYTTVPGFFLQDEAATNATTFDYTAVNFGLLNRTYPTDKLFDLHRKKSQWQRFSAYVESLNLLSGPLKQYKVLWMGRHGEGYHNAAQTYYGTPAWNCYYSELDGNGTVVWADAHLTPNGVEQAQVANTFWTHEIATQKIQTPQSFYTSPLFRCLATANITFTGLALPKKLPFVPTVKELFREGISGHTCDRRSNKTFIHDSFPTYKIEKGFTEDDELWVALHGETNQDQDIRSRKVLDEVFSVDRNTYISITSHSGEIASLLRVMGHQPFSLNTGAVIPVLMKVSTIFAKEPVTSSQPYTLLSTCATPPPPTAT